ncbi:hypothetical protein ABZY02_19085 [Streptomyces sp. NPDC006649]|uniref:hypothetical protein n=1 Tax=unclassified Streptomyces TaxID=2593676 RepID=UPI0033A51E83
MSTTTMSGPVYLLLPSDPAQPAEGCDVCEALEKERAAAHAIGDGSKASDCNVEMHQHPHKGKAGKRAGRK